MSGAGERTARRRRGSLLLKDALALLAILSLGPGLHFTRLQASFHESGDGEAHIEMTLAMREAIYAALSSP